MLEQTEQPQFDMNEESEFDYYLMWEWPAHIEQALRRMLWISLVEAAEGEEHQHTEFIRWQIATYPESPAVVLDYLSNINNEKLLIRIAENPNVSAPTLARLAESQYVNVRIAVADNQNTPIHIIKLLTQDEALDVRYSMAENPALPASLLTDLSNDDNVYVSARAKRTMARRNPASVEQLRRKTSEERKLG